MPGTTLIKLLFERHPMVSTIKNNNTRNDEGQFFQTVCSVRNRSAN